MSDAIILPDSGDGSRRARRQRPRREAEREDTPQRTRKGKPRRKRPPREPRSGASDERRRWPFVLLVIVLLAGGATAWFVTRDDGNDSGSVRTPNARVATTRTVGLLIERTSDARLAGATLFVDPGQGGDVMFLPPGTMVEAPPLGLVPL